MIQSPTGQAHQALAQLEQSSQPLMDWIADHKVTSPETQKNAEDLLISARAARKQAEDKRKELTRPLDEAKARIIDLFQPYLNRLDIGINMINRELTNYHESLIALEREQERRAMEEQAARMNEAQETGEIVEPAQPPSLPHVSKTSHAHIGTVTYRQEWDIKVVDPARVPRDLCEPSMSRIRARVKSGVINIPGVLVTPRTISTARKGGC